MAKKLFVGGLSYEVDEQGLEDLFKPFGTITSVVIVMDRDTGRSRGFGFVEMENDDEAQRAMDELNETEFAGRTIIVNEARPQRDRDNRGGGGGGGARRGGYSGGGGGRRY